jgi:ABC-type dipeptide/oligopeptide/nickel transport system ATPase component
MMDAILEIDSLTVRYGDDKLAVDGVSMKAPRESIVVIVGESGSGKSTLIRSVIGLLSAGGKIVGGKIFFQGNNILQLPSALQRKLRGGQIAMIFQEAGIYLNPKRKIGSQYIESIKSHLTLSTKDAYNLALSNLEKMYLPEPERIMEAYAFELSGGMCQRVAIAIAMTMTPLLMLADEPTSALDVTIQAQVIRQLMELRERHGTTILIVTHNFGIASYMADFIAVMKNGGIVEWGARDRVINEPRHSYTKLLLNAVPKMRTLYAGS